MAHSSAKAKESADLGNSSHVQDVVASSSKDSNNSLMNNRMKILDLLQECCICIDEQREDETLLLMSLRLRQHDSCIMHLIQVESDINAVNRYGKSAVHLAVKRPTIIVARELIQRGADIDIQDKNNFTALHYAAMKNHEAVCMLLYYNADVSIKCYHNLSPLNLALCSNEFESSETLMRYYADEDLAYDINSFLRNYPNALECLLMSNNPDLFKLIWAHIDYDILTNCPEPFLLTYLCHFSEWLECLQLVLQSDFVVDLIEHFNDYVLKEHMSTFISLLYYTFRKNNIDMNNRMATIYMALSLGTKIYLNDFNTTFEMYQFDAEVEALIYAADFDPDPDGNFWFALLPFILALNKDFSPNSIMKMFKKQIEHVSHSNNELKQNLIVNALKFFSHSRHNKSYLLTLCCEKMANYNQIAENLETIPEFPSLLELSRNQAYLFTLKAYKVEKPYQFQDAVKKLRIPQILQDIIRFKVPLY